jgi:hypothetical protein
MGFHQVLSNSPLAAGDFELSDLEALMSTLASLTGVQLIVRDAIGHLEPIMGRLQREAEQAERIGELESTNAALEARVAEMEAALKANGHSDKVAKKQKAMAD